MRNGSGQVGGRILSGSTRFAKGDFGKWPRGGPRRHGGAARDGRHDASGIPSRGAMRVEEDDSAGAGEPPDDEACFSPALVMW